MRGFQHALALCMALAAGPALADDWYQISGGQCFDATAQDAKLGTPQGLASVYQDLGETVDMHQLPDGAGGTIFVLRITDSSGDPFLNTTFFPSLADCQSVLNYEKPP